MAKSGNGLKSNTYKIVSIKKKTKAQVFEKFQVGDLIQFEMEIEHAGRASGGGVYASDVRTVNLTQGIAKRKSQSQLVSILDNFEIEVVSNEGILDTQKEG